MKWLGKWLMAALLVCVLSISFGGIEVKAGHCAGHTDDCGCNTTSCNNIDVCYYNSPWDYCDGHNFGNTWTYVSTSATCTGSGYQKWRGYCSICKTWYELNIPEGPLGHNYGGWSKHSNTQHVRSCSRCGVKDYANHRMGNWYDGRDGWEYRDCSDCSYQEKRDKEKPSISSFTATPTSWSAGNGTVKITARDKGSGIDTIVITRVNVNSGATKTVGTYSHNGSTSSVTDTYTETSEGVFYYTAAVTDKLGNKSTSTSATIYLDHSNPVISGVNNTETTWTATAPRISVSATDYLSRTSYSGSGVKSLVIKDDSGNIVKSGTASATYTLTSAYQGTHTWTIIATDNVNHTSTATITTRYDASAPNCSEFSATPTVWSAGNGTVKFTVQDAWSGLSSIKLERYSYVTNTWKTVGTWNYSGTTSAVTKTYTETEEGVFYYKLTVKDMLSNTLTKTSATIYLDHSNPVLSGMNTTVTDWTNQAPRINVSATDYLAGTTYTGSGVKSVVIKDDAGTIVSSGTSSASYTLAARYEGIHTWTIIATDNVNHTSSATITTKYDCTAPGMDGTEVTYVSDGVAYSGYCQDNIISQHVDDAASRSPNRPNATSGLRSIIVYRVKNGSKTAIYSATTQHTWTSPDTNSYFDVFYDMESDDVIADYYEVTVSDFAGNRYTKKLISQRSLLTWFHTSIDRSTYR